MKTFRLTIHRILADGDTAVVQHSISAKTRAGEQYENEVLLGLPLPRGEDRQD